MQSKKLPYEAVEAEIIAFAQSDVLETSGDNESEFDPN